MRNSSIFPRISGPCALVGRHRPNLGEVKHSQPSLQYLHYSISPLPDRSRKHRCTCSSPPNIHHNIKANWLMAIAHFPYTPSCRRDAASTRANFAQYLALGARYASRSFFYRRAPASELFLKGVLGQTALVEQEEADINHFVYVFLRPIAKEVLLFRIAYSLPHLSYLFPDAGGFTSSAVRPEQRPLDGVRENLDRTGFVAAGGSPPCLWKKGVVSEQTARNPGPTCEPALIAEKNQTAKTAPKKPSPVPGCPVQNLKSRRKARNDASSRKLPSRYPSSEDCHAS